MDVTKGDEVIILSGADKGKTGRVLHVFPKRGLVLVERIRMVKRHTKAGRQGLQQSEILEREAPIAVSKVALISAGKPTRVRHEKSKDGTTLRVAVKGGQVIERKKG